MVVLLLNYKKIKHVSGANLKESVLFVSVQSVVICLVAYLSNMLFVFVFNETISMFIAGMITVAVFAASYYVLFVMRDKDDGKAIWKGKLT